MSKGLGNILKQAQKMQEQLTSVQQELAQKTVEGSAGGGMVTTIANGKGEILGIKIERQVVNPEEIDMLEDLVTASVNEALRKSHELVSNEMSKITGGLNLPGIGGFKIPGLF